MIGPDIDYDPDRDIMFLIMFDTIFHVVDRQAAISMASLIIIPVPCSTCMTLVLSKLKV